MHRATIADRARRHVRTAPGRRRPRRREFTHDVQECRGHAGQAGQLCDRRMCNLCWTHHRGCKTFMDRIFDHGSQPLRLPQTRPCCESRGEACALVLPNSSTQSGTSDGTVTTARSEPRRSPRPCWEWATRGRMVTSAFTRWLSHDNVTEMVCRKLHVVLVDPWIRSEGGRWRLWAAGRGVGQSRIAGRERARPVHICVHRRMHLDVVPD